MSWTMQFWLCKRPDVKIETCFIPGSRRGRSRRRRLILMLSLRNPPWMVRFFRDSTVYSSWTSLLQNSFLTNPLSLLYEDNIHSLKYPNYLSIVAIDTIVALIGTITASTCLSGTLRIVVLSFLGLFLQIFSFATGINMLRTKSISLVISFSAFAG